jgi:hypothetical protein
MRLRSMILAYSGAWTIYKLLYTFRRSRLDAPKSPRLPLLFLYRGCGSGWSLTDRGCDPEISLYILGSIAGTLSLSEMSLFWSGGQCVLEAVITQVGMNLV